MEPTWLPKATTQIETSTLHIDQNMEVQIVVKGFKFTF